MSEFPLFVRNPANRIAASSQYTKNVEGYVFDGAEGSQVALWTAHAEYVLVIEGRCAVVLTGRRIELRAGEEIVIPKGTQQRMEVRRWIANDARLRWKARSTRGRAMSPRLPSQASLAVSCKVHATLEAGRK